MPDGDDEDQQPIIKDLIQHSVIADAHPPDVVRTAQLDRLWTARFGRDLVDGVGHAPLDRSVQAGQLP